MKKTSNDRKSEQLGMPYGTASNKLRKNIMFYMAQKLGLDTCVKCDMLIETCDEFTIEHIAPWMHVDPNLFWDLENIAFSHSKCNRPHGYPVYNLEERRRKRTPCGTQMRYRDGCRCEDCKAWKKTDNQKYRASKT